MAATELVVIEHSRVGTGLLGFRLLGCSGIYSSLGELDFRIRDSLEILLDEDELVKLSPF